MSIEFAGTLIPTASESDLERILASLRSWAYLNVVRDEGRVIGFSCTDPPSSLKEEELTIKVDPESVYLAFHTGGRQLRQLVNEFVVAKLRDLRLNCQLEEL